METALKIFALIVTAFLFGGMLLFTAGFAAFLFKVLPDNEARSLIRKSFPYFYLFVISVSLLAAILTASSDLVSASALALIALTTVPTRQILMPAINAATDSGDWMRFVFLHGASVVITLLHIVVSAAVLVRYLG